MEKVFNKPDDAKLIKKIKLGLGISLITIFVGQASAGVPVVDAVLNASVGLLNGNVIAFDADVTAENAALMALLEMQLGDDPTGATGTIPQMLEKIDGSIGSQTTTLKQEIDNIHGLQNSTEVQKLGAQYGMSTQPDIVNACGETAYATSFSDMNSAKVAISPHTRVLGGPAGGSGSQYIVSDEQNLTGAVSTESEMATDLLIKSANGYCTAEQGASGVAKCTAAGNHPGADIGSKALTQTTTNGVNSNYSLPYQSADYNAALASKDKLAGFSAANIPKTYANTSAGIEYTSLADLYARRKAVVLDAAQQQIDYSAAPNAGTAGASDLSTRWSSISGNYSQLFPDQTVPAIPSERELLRYYIYSRYASSTWQAKTGSDSESDALREIERMDAASLYLNYQILERMEKNNEIVAALLAQSYNPVTVDRLTELRKKVIGNGLNN